MKIMSKTLIAVTVLGIAGAAFAQADNSSGTTRSNRDDPSQMTTPPAGAEPGVTNRRDSMDNRRPENRSSTYDRRSTDNRGRSATENAADPSQMTTPPEGATPGVPSPVR